MHAHAHGLHCLPLGISSRQRNDADIRLTQLFRRRLHRRLRAIPARVVRCILLFLKRRLQAGLCRIQRLLRQCAQADQKVIWPAALRLGIENPGIFHQQLVVIRSHHDRRFFNAIDRLESARDQHQGYGVIICILFYLTVGNHSRFFLSILSMHHSIPPSVSLPEVCPVCRTRSAQDSRLSRTAPPSIARRSASSASA